MRILIAPDKFKDALTANQAADAIAKGVRAALPDAQLDIQPIGDGGEGTGRLLADGLGYRPQRATVRNPRGAPQTAVWWKSPEGHAAVVEMAEASGLALLPPALRNPLETTSYGTGELIAAAIAAGCKDITVCVGGSATVDGGVGCLQALGWTFLDIDGNVLSELLTGGQLHRVKGLRWPELDRAADLTVLCDVDNLLLGDDGAARAFAGQKGADADQVALLADALHHWSAVLRVFTGKDVSKVPGTGAAGGLPAALLAAESARLVSGFDEVAHQLRLRGLIGEADLVITGEGRFDATTASGKAVAGIASIAHEIDVPIAALVGSVDESLELSTAADALHLERVIPISPPDLPLEQALAQTSERLAEAAGQYVLQRA